MMQPLMSKLGDRIYRFADVEVNPARGCLMRGGQQQYLRQKTFQVLLYLLQERHRLVTKDELIEQVWEGRAVTDDALVKCISDIRKALGDDSHHPQFVKTLPKVGYHFIGSVEECWWKERALSAAAPGQHTLEIEEVTSIEVEEKIEEDEAESRNLLSESRSLISSPSHLTLSRHRRALTLAFGVMLVLALAFYFGQQRRSAERVTTDVVLPRLQGKKPLVVMYFENQSGDRELNWLREGLADMLITDLARSKHLSVLSRQQMHLLLERIGQAGAEKIRLDEALALGRRSQAEAVALGSFAKLGEKMWINVQLYDAAGGQVLASESLVADKADQILSQMDLLSLKLASHLGAAPAEDETKLALASIMTNSLEAYRYYSLALEQAQMFQFQETIEMLEKAIALDPQFAMAHARIGYVYAVRMGQGEKAIPYLEKAFRLSDRLTEKDKLYINAWYANAKHDALTAIESYQKMLVNYPLEVEAYQRLGWLLISQEKFDEARLAVKHGLVIDAEAKDLYNGLGTSYAQQGKYDEAIAAYQHYVRLAPSDPNALDSLGAGHQMFGRYEEAIAAYQRALALNPESRVAIIHLGNTYFQQGRYQAAIEQYQRYIQVARDDKTRGRGYEYLAHVYLKKGDLGRAEAAARQATQCYKQAAWVSLPIAVARGDRRAVEKLKPELLASLSQAELAERGYLRIYYHCLGYVAQTSGHAEEAIKYFKEAVRHQPVYWNFDLLEDCLANAYLEFGWLNEAIAEYERLLRFNPNYPLAHYHLGQAYERQGKWEQARAAYQRFLEIWKDADRELPVVVQAKERLAASELCLQQACR